MGPCYSYNSSPAPVVTRIGKAACLCPDVLYLQEFEQMRWSIEPLTYRYVSLIWHSSVCQLLPAYQSAALLVLSDLLCVCGAILTSSCSPFACQSTAS